MSEANSNPEQVGGPEHILERLAEFVKVRGPEVDKKLRATRRNISSKRGSHLEDADKLDDVIDYLNDINAILGLKVGERTIQTHASLGKLATSPTKPPIV